MQKVERLLNLTAFLLHTARPLTAAEIRIRVGGYPPSDAGFRRAFERDKEDLREMGIPLEVVEAPDSDPPVAAYRIARSRYYLDDPDLAPDELLALQFAVSAVGLDDASSAEAMWKLGGAQADPNEEPRISLMPPDENLGPLMEALASRSIVCFTYAAAERRVRPYRIGFQSGHWYLRGLDETRGAARVYRLDRIQSGVAVQPGRSFEVPAAEAAGPLVAGGPWEIGDEEPVLAELLVDASHAPVALNQFGADAIIRTRGDGSVVVELLVTNRAAFRDLVLRYLEHAEVIAPTELRESFVQYLEALRAGSVAGGG